LEGACRRARTFPRKRLTTHNRLVMVPIVPMEPSLVFKALADPTRRAIFERLTRDGELTVHVLTDHAGISQPAVSKHLTVLKRARLVRDRRHGRETPMVNWMNFYGAFWREKFDRLEAVLERMEP